MEQDFENEDSDLGPQQTKKGTSFEAAGGIAVIKAIARETARFTVSETLLSLGFDMSKPIQIQHDMIALRELREIIETEAYQKDMAHLREWRVTMESVKSKGILTVVSLVVLGIIALVLIAVKSKLGFFVG